MPKFTIKVIVTNNGNTSVTAHVGASLVGASDHIEYYNASEDITQKFNIGVTSVTRYLTTDLGIYQKYYLYVALWEGEKPIGFPYYIVRFKQYIWFLRVYLLREFPYYIVRFKPIFFT